MRECPERIAKYIRACVRETFVYNTCSLLAYKMYQLTHTHIARKCTHIFWCRVFHCVERAVVSLMCAADDTRDRECTSNFATLLIFAQRFPLCTKCNFVHTHTHTHTHLSVAVFARAMCICTSAVAGVSHAFQVK